MNARSTTAGLLGFATIALAGACGGEIATQQGDGGERASGPAPVTGPATSDAAACSAELLVHAPGTALGTCWSCIAKSCTAEVTACMADCPCDKAIADALNCSDTGQAGSCFISVVLSGDAAQLAVGQCITKAQAECPCNLSG